MSLDTVKVPSLEQVAEAAAELGFSLDAEELAVHRELLLPSFAAYNLIDRLPDEVPPVVWPRRPGRRPLPEGCRSRLTRRWGYFSWQPVKELERMTGTIVVASFETVLRASSEAVNASASAG